MRWIRFLCVVFSLTCTYFLRAGDIEHPSLVLENASHIFIELGLDNSDLQSAYALIIPSGGYLLLKSYDKMSYKGFDTTIIENVQLPKLDGGMRYQLDSGFAFFRTSNDPIYSSYASNKEIIENIINILNYESNENDVHFYSYKDTINFANVFDVSCEGQVFSPKRNSNTGHFFFRKFKKGEYNKRACYLISYDYVSEYEVAKAEFKRLLSCIWLISDGYLQVHVPSNSK